ncbi:hypothetical protein ABNG03_10160 [Halorubrum sp. RMP-47]|uniref:Transcriptional regulator n=1 Tax=Halorubrum miltondacostae TaxID=3076378 RepID=A0ABD5M006_9EURY
MNKDTEATFVRRKFTITEELDAELERMADNNYQGNVSLCLRQAVTDHRETLRGNGEVTLRRLMESVAHIEDQASELTQSVDTLVEQVDPTHTARPEATVANVTGEPPVVAGGDQIVAALEETDTPLRVADIIERVEMQPVDVRYLLGYLVDHAHVFSTQEDPARYYLATSGLNSTDRDELGGPSG